MIMHFEHTITRDNGERLELTLKCAFQRGSMGARDSLGVPEEPDEPAAWELEEASDEDGNPVDLSEKESDQIDQFLTNLDPHDGE